MVWTKSIARSRRLIPIAASAAVFLGAASLGCAAPTDSDDTPTCAKDEVYDQTAKKCVKQNGNKVSDAERTKYAYALAKAKRYDEALAMLDKLDQPNTAEALNYRGYVTRKLGRTDEGIGYYLKAMSLNPRYPQVREYLGEAYVIKGRMDLAKEQLAAIKDLCGTDCGEYHNLQAAIRAQPRSW